MKLDPKKKSYDQGEFWWVGSPDCRPAPNTDEELLVSKQYDIEIHGGVCDKDASYSYDDFALCELDGVFYMLQTSGCSCPSPSETWRVVAKGTVADMYAYVVNPKKPTCAVPVKQLAEFLALINDVALAVANKRPL